MATAQNNSIGPAGEMAESAKDLAGRLATGALTSAELTEAALARTQSGEGRYTFIRVYHDWARQLAALSDQTRNMGLARSPIEGLTVSIKDLFDVAGETTCAGSAVLRDAAPAREHAEVVKKLLQAGAVIIGRTNMTEFAYSGLGLNPHYGTPANPWRRESRRIPGGSSSGAAVSVADGMCSAAIGSDTGGSIRIPAALCGLVGFKPTAARISRAGVLPLSEALDSVGVIARDVASCVLFDAAIAERPLPVARRNLRQARFAVPRTVVLDGMDEHVSRAFGLALERLGAQGAWIEYIDIPEFSLLAGINANGGFTAAESWAWHEALLSARRNEYDPRVASRIERGKGFPARDLLALAEARRSWIARVESRLADYEAMLMPTVPTIAPEISALEADEELYFSTNAAMLRNPSFINFLDGCSVSIPCHMPGQAPVGLSIAGTRSSDAAVVQWALAIEAAMAMDERAG